MLVSIKTCVLNNKEEGYKVRRYSTTSVLVDASSPNKGYVKTYTDYPISCMWIEYTNKSKTKTIISQANYIFTILPNTDLLNINEKDILINSDGNEMEILFTEAFKIRGVIEAYEVYVR